MLLEKLLFVLVHYLGLLAFATAALGAGALLVGRTKALQAVEQGLAAVIVISAGFGLLISALFVLGTLGLLSRGPVGTLLVLSTIGASLVYRKPLGEWLRAAARGDLRREVSRHWFWIAAVTLFVVPMLIMPLMPPVHWDEVMYHLPYARYWADRGRLDVHPFLRYPLFPFNYDLLYAAALTVGDEILPHLLHALAGWLVAAGIYLAARRYFDRRVGLLAAVIFLTIVRWGFDNAYIDLGLTLFVFSAFLCLALWYDKGEDTWLYLSMFCLGLAIGTKYTALLHVPIVGVLVLARERRPAVLARAAAVFLAAGSPWYVRNYLVSGDPIHPFGGPYFGYWLWDERDLQDQRANIDWIRDPLPSLLIPALGAWLLLRRSSMIFKGLCLVAYAALLAWVATSRYERYLTPAHPLLAMLSAVVIVRVVRQRPLLHAWQRVSSRVPPRFWTLAKVAIVAVVGFRSLAPAADSWSRICQSPEDRDSFLSNRFGAYTVLRDLRDQPGWRLYQFGFEHERYYAPELTVGDWFGPGRYRHVFERANDAGALADHLRSLNVNALLVNLRREPFSTVTFDARMPEYFELVRRTPSAVLYRLRDTTARPARPRAVP